MIRLKIEKDKKQNVILKAAIKKELFDNQIIKRLIIEGKKLKTGQFNYQLPIRYLLPVVNNLDKKLVRIDKRSINSFIEFSDEYDKNYYCTTEANFKYMKKWREVGCPKIYRIDIDCEGIEVVKTLAFERRL
ncbi:hypothetical protein CPJCM30710_12830 [Clostridium polyendosporum]|uniref:Uncharacterized protein n=1 Tax=Clostridium polyendosporum TaxID=69208 RepID=A0A919RY46_9CLOT|nr:hypothetical protein [Clostridium polyendosporum]GIM28617.1 hypothetical protein CPJCM30710_12830 [Clostridium polyendosporum]